MESAAGEDAVKTIEMTTKDLECYINSVDKAAAGFERIDSHFERDKMLLNSLSCYTEIIPKKESQSMRQASLLSDFKKSPQPLQPSARSPSSTSINTQAGPSTSKHIMTC